MRKLRGTSAATAASVAALRASDLHTVAVAVGAQAGRARPAESAPTSCAAIPAALAALLLLLHCAGRVHRGLSVGAEPQPNQPCLFSFT